MSAGFLIGAQDDVLDWEGEIGRAVPGAITGAALKYGWLVTGEKIDGIMNYGVIAEGST